MDKKQYTRYKMNIQRTWLWISRFRGIHSW